MKKFFSLFVLLMACSFLHAQLKVKFILKEKTAIHHDSIFITGTITDWDSTANPKYLLKPIEASEKSITLLLPPGVMRYKYHRGSWLTVEKQYNGDEASDRIINLKKDTTLTDSVFSWRDQTLLDKTFSLSLSPPDSVKIKAYHALIYNYGFLQEYYNIDSAFLYAQKAMSLLQIMRSGGKNSDMTDVNYYDNLIHLQHHIAGLMYSLGNYPKALELGLDNLAMAEKLNDKILIASHLSYIIGDYTNMKDYEHALHYSQRMNAIMENAWTNDTAQLVELRWQAKYNMGNTYYKMKMIDSALFYAKSVFTFSFPAGIEFYRYVGYGLLADIYNAKGIHDSALLYYHKAIHYFREKGVPQATASIYTGLARLFNKEGRLDSALLYARRAFDVLRTNKITVQAFADNSDSYIMEVSPLIAELYYANHQPDSAYKYLLLSQSLRDSLYNADRIRQFQTLTFNDAARQQQLEQQKEEAKQEYRTKMKIYGLIAVIAAVLVVVFVLYRNNKHKQKANTLLQNEKEKVETTLSQLKSAQAQLIQSEKMASLGELTAGIAHEIQNPLNFVNNFSEVNKELIEELNTERLKPNAERDEQLESDLLKDIKDNEEKINHHGKRADAIVKGMLQHSRSSSGQKEPTDINALCDEYLRLSYHGLRAKDKSFNAKFETGFDKSIGKINIVAQDIGRVILNLINNAFYAVSEKRKAESGNFEPAVIISTRKTNGTVEISVKDNGNGIPQKILDKIFQPFFTTKPTGQGTGLGLSLAYDIVKAHAGELRAKTIEGEGSEFIVQLPLNKIE